jgi:hypothetical protein
LRAFARDLKSGDQSPHSKKRIPGFGLGLAAMVCHKAVSSAINWRPMSESRLKSKWMRGLITLFILFHVYIMAIWGLPGSGFRAALSRPIEKYVIYIGLWHSWDMFSPDPLSLNFLVQAEIIYQDGSKKTWDFPQMDKLSLWERFQKERYRKWGERVRQDAYAGIWDDTCRFIARINDTPTNHPARVILIRNWEPIPPPVVIPGASSPLDFQPRPDHYDMHFNYRFKFYDVQPGDL